MVFEEWELRKIIESLSKGSKKDLSADLIRLKLEQVMMSSINKRYTIRTTDWCVENGKKSAGRRKKTSYNSEIY